MVSVALSIFLLLGNLSDEKSFSDENQVYKYTVGINFLSSLLPLFSVEIKFEPKIKEHLSLNFSLSTAPLLFTFLRFEIGIREYLSKKLFDGFYLHQGFGGTIISYDSKANFLLDFSLVGGYKFILEEGFTIDPFLGIGVGPRFFLSTTSRFFILPRLGLYIGYSW